MSLPVNKLRCKGCGVPAVRWWVLTGASRRQYLFGYCGRHGPDARITVSVPLDRDQAVAWTVLHS